MKGIDKQREFKAMIDRLKTAFEEGGSPAYREALKKKNTRRDAIWDLGDLPVSSIYRIHTAIKDGECELKEGYIRCAYCEKAIKKTTAHIHTIIFKGNTKGKPEVETNKYCNSMCGIHDQYAHEG